MAPLATVFLFLLVIIFERPCWIVAYSAPCSSLRTPFHTTRHSMFRDFLMCSPAKKNCQTEVTPPHQNNNHVSLGATGRRYALSLLLGGGSTVARTAIASAVDDPSSVTLRLTSPRNLPLGIELSTTSPLTIKTLAAQRKGEGLSEGMILQNFGSLEELKGRLTGGPYPVDLTFGPPQTSFQPADVGRSSAVLWGDTYQVESTRRLPDTVSSSCSISSQKDDVLEIRYTAAYVPPYERSQSQLSFVYDSSQTRGTGLPYFMVLGSYDMLPGVDQGLYDMRPGEARRLIIPPALGYGRKGNRIFGVPPDSVLIWDVELVSVNGDLCTSDS